MYLKCKIILQYWYCPLGVICMLLEVIGMKVFILAKFKKCLFPKIYPRSLHEFQIYNETIAQLL